jgi:hypothetical protein
MIRALAVAISLAGIAAAQTPTAQDALLVRLAIDMASEKEPAPVPIGPAGTGPYAFAFDRFTRAHVAARAAASQGSALDPLKPPRDLLLGQLLLVAVPVSCGDRVVRPLDVNMDLDTKPVPRWLAVRGAALQKLLPGITVPPDAIGVQFQDAALRSAEIVKISYADAICSGTGKQITVPVTSTVPRARERPVIEMPPGQPAPKDPITLTISGVLDLDGGLRYASAPEASTPAGAAAMAAAGKMRFDPARINGAPVPWTAGVIVDFGIPVPASTASLQSTSDTSGLSAETSRCPVSTDDAYGVFGAYAIRIGGGIDGAARIEKYLAVLRGPSGQGLQHQSTGPVLTSGRSGVTLESVEVRYAGLAKPMRIFFDPSREGPLMAPKGFTCAAPIAVK